MIVRVKSHRAYDKLANLLGYKPKGFFSFFFDGHFCDIPDSCTEALNIKGVTRSRVDVSRLQECVSWQVGKEVNNEQI